MGNIFTAYEALILMKNNPYILMRWNGYVKTCKSFDENECMDMDHPMCPTNAEVCTGLDEDHKPVWTKITCLTADKILLEQ